MEFTLFSHPRGQGYHVIACPRHQAWAELILACEDAGLELLGKWASQRWYPAPPGYSTHRIGRGELIARDTPKRLHLGLHPTPRPGCPSCA